MKQWKPWNRFRLITAMFALALCMRMAMAQDAPVLPPAIQPGDAVAAGKTILPPQDKAAIIKLHGEVDDMMRKSIERRLDIARKAGCTLVIYEIDTSRGLHASGIEISKLTRGLPADSHLATVAWINAKAISSGSLIAASCQHIVMAPGGTFGNCAPINVSDHALFVMPPTERTKFATPLIEEFNESAKQNGYNPLLLRAMVDVTIEVQEIEERKTGRIRFVDTQEKNALTAVPPGEKESPWRYVETIDTADQLLTIADPNLAIKMGLCQAIVSDQQQLRDVLNIRGELLVLDFNWAEVATVWLTDNWVRGMLFFAMLVLAYIEFSHPGVTVPGIAAVICLVLLEGAPFLTGLAQIWEIALVVLGLGIIVADLLIFGGIGLFAVPGFVLMAIGLVASFVPTEPGGGFSLAGSWLGIRSGLMVVVFGSLAAFAAFALLSRYLYMTPGFRRLQLAPASGTSATGTGALRDASDGPSHEAVFPGAVGKAATDLRPAGKARFGEHLLDVVSYGSFIERDSEVEVAEISGNHVVVKPHKNQAQV